MRCPRCHEPTERRKVTRDLAVEGTLRSIRNVPGYVCDTCQGRWFAIETEVAVDRILVSLADAGDLATADYDHPYHR